MPCSKCAALSVKAISSRARQSSLSSATLSAPPLTATSTARPFRPHCAQDAKKRSKNQSPVTDQRLTARRKRALSLNKKIIPQPPALCKSPRLAAGLNLRPNPVCPAARGARQSRLPGIFACAILSMNFK
jgi:hypothetical protein